MTAPPSVVVAGSILTVRRVLASRAGTGAPDWLARVHAGGEVGGAGPAAALAARDAGARPVLLGRVGDDEAGRLCVQTLSDLGVDTAHMCVQSGRSTDVEIEVISDAPGADASCWITVDQSDLGSGRWEPPVPADDIVASCRPGDALVVDALTMPHVTPLLERAYDADLQIVADLRPFPHLSSSPYGGGGLDPESLRRVDVAVVDLAGAGVVAESGVMPASLVTLAAAHRGSGGASWDGEFVQLREALAAADAAASDRDPDSDPDPDPDLDYDETPWARHTFCGALAAALADGEDRREALAVALLAWWRALDSRATGVRAGRPRRADRWGA